VVFRGVAVAGRASGSIRPASNSGRRDLIMCVKTLQARGDKNEGQIKR
jgi:hypothetical protein